MTIEEDFFKTFGIEPIGCECYDTSRYCEGMVDCSECASAIYPEITSDILLKLICLINKYKKIKKIPKNDY